ncbi:ABC transporter ATP-binding protein [Bacillus siamensis]|uniref:ABC transporter ATP-binding protein n=1 Tax=Bacillus siamensis TaxID=659243 RepID=UPI002E2169B8|nr:ABC transporter ATP-binding protein [Bacillus siamensis]MED5097492.1 ABC transporter ATP-binding protein [Bacillus siamensis]
MFAIETDNLTKKYGDRKVVDSVNLQVKQGDIHGFLGKNGAGKSTLINMINDIIQPTSGSYQLLGTDMLSIDMIMNRIGVLPDYSTFYDDLTPLQHLKYFDNIFNQKKSKSELIDLLERVGLGNALNIKAKKFSFGMKKKLGIAQAIQNNPDLIFLDEPTSGVDAESALQIHSLLKELKSLGKTIFLTSHNLDEVQKLADEISIMEGGKIKLQGSLRELQRAYQSSLNVYLRHSTIPNKYLDSIKNTFLSVGENVEVKPEESQVTVDDESYIPKLTRSLNDISVDVYRIDVNEPNLEEIFIDLKDGTKS